MRIIFPLAGILYWRLFRLKSTTWADSIAFMVKTKQHALKIASEARKSLEQIYGQRLRGVYLYGSAARGQFTVDSDIDIAVVLDEIPNRFAEHERTSQLCAELSLRENTLVTLLFVAEADYEKGLFTVYRTIRREGIPA